MSAMTFTLIGIGYYIITVVIIVCVLNFIANKDKKKYKKEIDELERDKNLIISASILSELNKVEPLMTHADMREVFEEWNRRFKEIKDSEVPKITDELLEIEDLYDSKNYNALEKKLAGIEMRIAYVKTKTDFLLEEIKGITLSEERNRETITKLKSAYREILSKYNENKIEYQEVSAPLELQFENVDKLFSAFEASMEKNAYQEVGKIVKALDDTIGNLKMVIEEAPSIILMGKKMIPNKIEDLREIKAKMEKEGYILDFINLEYNITEAQKKLADIFQRLNVLNLEDSVFELKTMNDYFDSIYTDFDTEKVAKKIFEEYARTILAKAIKLEKINHSLYKKIDEIKFSYDLTDEDVSVISIIANELKEIREKYDEIIECHRKKVLPYAKLGKEMENLNVKLTKTEEKLEIALRSLGSLKEDELRAREQLDEIKKILKEAKEMMKSYHLPIVPKNYYVQLSEAVMGIEEMQKELESTPISIKVLNTRVDTARDLVLKVYNTTKETIKTAKMAETAIVYGNRYRPTNKDVDFGLTKAENAFYKGSFKKALENALNAINIVEPGIQQKLIDEYQ